MTHQYPPQPRLPNQVNATTPRKNIAVIVIISIVVAALVVGGCGADSSNIAGTWNATLSAQSGPFTGQAGNAQLTIQQNGNQLTAQLTVNNLGVSLTGTMSGQSVSLSNTECPGQGQTSCSRTLTGTTSDSTHMSGTYAFQYNNADGTSENDSGTWNATKSES